VSLPLEGNSSSLSSQQVVTSKVSSSGSGEASGASAVLLEKKIISQTSAEGGASRSYVISCESRNHPLSSNVKEIGSINTYFQQYLLKIHERNFKPIFIHKVSEIF